MYRVQCVKSSDPNHEEIMGMIPSRISYTLPSGVKVYFSGNSFVEIEKAESWKDSLQSIGINNAFVRAFRNNKILSLQVSQYSIRKARERGRSKYYNNYNRKYATRKKTLKSNKVARSNTKNSEKVASVTKSKKSGRKELNQDLASGSRNNVGSSASSGVNSDHLNKKKKDEELAAQVDLNKRSSVEDSKEVINTKEQESSEGSKSSVVLYEKTSQGGYNVKTKESVLSKENKAKKDLKNTEEVITATTSKEMEEGLMEKNDEEKKAAEIKSIEKELATAAQKINEYQEIETELQDKLSNMISAGATEDEIIEFEMKLHETLTKKEEQAEQELIFKKKLEKLSQQD